LLNYEPLEYTDKSLPYEPKLSEIRWHNNVDGDERRSYEGCLDLESTAFKPLWENRTQWS